MLRQTLGAWLTGSFTLKSHNAAPQGNTPHTIGFYGVFVLVMAGIYALGLVCSRFLLQSAQQSLAENLFALSGVVMAGHPVYGRLRARFYAMPVVASTSATPTGYLTGGWLALVRMVWLGVAVASAYVIVVAIPLLYAGLMQTQPMPAPMTALPITLAEAHTIENLGLPAHAYALLFVGNRLAVYVVFMAIAVIIAGRRSNHWVAMLVSIFLISFATTGVIQQEFMLPAAPLAYWVSEVIQTLANMLILVVLYLFPNGRFVPGWTRTLLVAWLLYHAISLFMSDLPFNFTFGDTWQRTFWASLVFSELWIGTGIVAIFYRYCSTATPLERLQIKWVMLTWLCAYLVGAAYVCVPLVFKQQGIYLDGLPRLLYVLTREVFGGVGIALGAVAFGMSILRYKLWDIERMVRRSVLWLAASCLVLSGYVLFTVVIVRLLRNIVWLNSTFSMVVYTLLAAFLFNPLRHRAQRIINRKFDRLRVDTGIAITRFARDLRETHTTPQQLQLLLQHTVQLLQISHGAVLLLNEQQQPCITQSYQLTDEASAILLDEWPLHTQRAQQLSAAPPLFKVPTSRIALPKHLHIQRNSHAPPRRTPGEQLYPAVLPLTALQSGQVMLVGILALGPRLSEQAYTRKDLDLLAGLAEQASAAMSVSQLAGMERELKRELAHEKETQRHSPQGKARAWVQQWQTQPGLLLPELHGLVQQTHPQAQEILEALPQAAAWLEMPMLRTLAQGYRYWSHAHANPEMLSVGLREIVAGLMQADAWPGAHESAELFRVCLQWLNFSSISNVSPIVLLAQPPAMGSPHLQPLVQSLHSFCPVIRALTASQQASQPNDQMAYLSEASEHLDGLTFEWLPPHERLVPEQIKKLWSGHIHQSMYTLQGRAELQLHLITRQVVAVGDVLVCAIELTNTGLSVATQVQVELLPNPAYELISSWAVAEDMPTGCSAHLHFTVQLSRQATLSSLSLGVRLHYTDAAPVAHVQDSHLVVKLLRAPSVFRLIPNPYRAGPPLHAGSPTFVGREEDLTFIVHTLSRSQSHLALTGQQRMGKTSLLRQLGALMGHTHMTVFLDGQRLGLDPGLSGFFYDIACEICAALNLDCPDFDLFDKRPAHAFEQIFLPEILPSLHGRSLLMLFDEVEALEWRVAHGKLEHDLFNMLRHIMQHQPHLSFVFVGTHRMAELNPLYWSRLLNNALQHRIGHLPAASALKLITEPVHGLLCYDDLALVRLTQLVAGHPYFLQLFCQVLVDQANTEQRTFVLSDHVEAAMARVFELAEGQLAEAWQSLSPCGQHILLAMMQFNVPTLGAVTRAQLTDQLNNSYDTHDSHDIQEALNQLVNQEIVARVQSARCEAYVWRLGVLGMWASKHQAMSSIGTNR